MKGLEPMRKTHHLLSYVLVTVCLLLSTTACAHAKVGFINTQRLVNESERGKAASLELQKLRKEKEIAIKTKEIELRDFQDTLKKEADTIPANVLPEKIEPLRKLNREYKRMIADAKEDLNRENRELVALILKEAATAVENVVKKHNYTMIIKDPNVIAYVAPASDITDLVLEELNALNK
jgi:outer membrane protein